MLLQRQNNKVYVFKVNTLFFKANKTDNSYLLCHGGSITKGLFSGLTTLASTKLFAKKVIQCS